MKRGNVIFQWLPPKLGSIKFNVDGAMEGKLKLAGIADTLKNEDRDVLCSFWFLVDVLVIQKAMRIFKANCWEN